MPCVNMFSLKNTPQLRKRNTLETLANSSPSYACKVRIYATSAPCPSPELSQQKTAILMILHNDYTCVSLI